MHHPETTEWPETMRSECIYNCWEAKFPTIILIAMQTMYICLSTQANVQFDLGVLASIVVHHTLGMILIIFTLPMLFATKVETGSNWVVSEEVNKKSVALFLTSLYILGIIISYFINI